ncbi:MAG: hypothetical protein FJX73_10615 [Armatimonadetes bacterium]|nr:hypothetical protein [Armatimonadota bacterium]
MRTLLRHPAFWAVAMAVLAFSVYALSYGGQTPFNHYVLLADAFLNGRLDLDRPPRYLEMTQYDGRFYVIPPPGPAILLLPYVAVWGLRASQSLASWLTGAFAAGLMVLLASRLTPKPRDYLWFGAMGAFGTIIWFLSAVGSTWYFAHVVAVAGLSLSLVETFGARRPTIIGAGIAVAYLSHLPTVLTLPFFLAATRAAWWPGGLGGWRRVDLSYLIRLAGPIAAAVLLNSAYNYLRFGTVADVANAVRPGILDEPWFSRGLFHISYIPRHLHIMFLDRPVLVPHPPFALVPWTGLAIWVTTPAFVYALRAPLRAEALAAWVSILLVSMVVMSFGATGTTQFGYRLATDFYPLLFVLTIWGMRGRPSLLAKALMVAGVIVNAWGVVFWRLGWIVP